MGWCNIVRGANSSRNFVCPHCGVFSAHKLYGTVRGNDGLERMNFRDLRVSVCPSCQHYSLWILGEVVYPRLSNTPMPSAVMPAALRQDYMEARRVFSDSPRASAALLRLAVQKLCIHLGQPGRNLNDDIAALVRNGLPVHVQQAMDTVRVTGNNAVHPGEMSAEDTAEIARSMFDIVNRTVEAMIVLPQRIAETYNRIPVGAREDIARRDGHGGTTPDR